MRCNICGSPDTTVMSMGQGIARPNCRNENTFMRPNLDWGYIACAKCERTLPPARSRLEILPWILLFGFCAITLGVGVMTVILFLLGYR